MKEVAQIGRKVQDLDVEPVLPNRNPYAGLATIFLRARKHERMSR
jgi:hypothetical protein